MIDLEQMEEEEARELKIMLEKLIKSEGWLFFERFLKERIEGRTKELIALCPGSVPEMVQYARVKGGIEEAELIPEMLKSVIFDIQYQLDAMNPDQEED